MSTQNILVQLRNTTGSTISLGTLDINSSSTVTIWDSVNYTNGVLDNLEQVLVGIAEFNENVQNGNLVMEVDNVDQTVEQAFAQLYELTLAFQENRIESDFDVLKMNGVSIDGLSASSDDIENSSNISGATLTDAINSIDTSITNIDLDGYANDSDLQNHINNTTNPHNTDIGNLGSGTLAELNSIITDATLDDSSDSRDPNTHASTHENGGSDEISVTGLSGLLSDPQTPLSHASSHISGATDEVDGDQLDIDWNPSNYTPTTAPAEVTSIDQLTAHLAGIDNALSGVGVSDHGNLTGLGDDDHTQYLLVDGTRSMSGNLDIDGYDVFGISNVIFDSEYDNGNSGSSINIDWNNGSKQRITLNNNTTFSFTDVSGPSNFVLIIKQDATGDRDITWPSNVRSAGGSVNISADSNSETVIGVYFDGSNYYISSSPNSSGSVSTNLITGSGFDIYSHASRHESGGADEIDGYNLSIVYFPTNYSPTVNNLIGEHIASIDSAFSNIDHGELSGLGDDDHTQYLLVDGSRPMSNPLDLGSNSIVNVNLVDNRNISVDGSILDSHVANDDIHFTVDSLGLDGYIEDLQNHINNVNNPHSTTLANLTDTDITGIAQGDILYRNATEWVRLAAGTAGQFLQTQGAAANPQWATPWSGAQVYYVGKHGNDSNSGTSNQNAFLTFGAALTAASGQTPSTSNRFVVVCDDAGVYTENIDIPAWVSVYAPSAKVVGNVELNDNVYAQFDWIEASSSATVSKVFGGTDVSYIVANKVYGLGTGSSIVNLATNGVLMVTVKQVFAETIGIGDLTNNGHTHIEIEDLYLTANDAIGIERNSSGSTVGRISHILDVGALTGTTAIDVNSGEVNINVGEIDCVGAYNVALGGTLRMFVNKITGTQTGAGTINVSIAGEGSDYLLIDGTRAMTGSLDMGTNAITNVGNVDGRDVSADGATLDNHVANTSNPHSTSIANIGSGTLAQLNAAVTDATLDDSGDPRDPNAHASTHISGGSDELDGDQLDIDWNPTNYTPNTAPTQVTSADHLTAHLAGIDDAFANVAGDVVGPAFATDNAIVRYDGTTGKLVQNSGVTIDDSNNVITTTNGSSAASPTRIGFEGFSSGEAYRLQLTLDEGWQSEFGGSVTLYSFNTLVLRGNRNTTGAPAFEADQGIGVLVQGEQTGDPSFVVRGQNAQTADILQIRDNPTSDTSLITVDSSGNITFSGAQEIRSGAARLMSYSGTTLFIGQDTGADLTDIIDIEAATSTTFSIDGSVVLTVGATEIDADIDINTNGNDIITGAGLVDGRDVSVDGTKLDGIEAGAQVNTVDSVFGRSGAVVAAASDYDANQIDYTNATSGLTATDVQAAIDEVVVDLSDHISTQSNPHFTNLANLTDTSIPSPSWGSILYRGSTLWQALPEGTSGQILQTQGANANPQWASLDDVLPSKVFEAYDATGGTTITTATTVPLNTQRVVDSIYTHSTVTNNGNVTITETGRYRITYQVGTQVSSGTSQSSSTSWLEADTGSGFSEVAGSRGKMENHNTTTGGTHVTRTVILDLTSGSVLRIRAQRLAGTTTVQLRANNSSLVIQSISYSASTQTPASHASTHILGGADEVDGDQLGITWTPTNYTRSTTPTEVTSTSHLTAHLAGINTALGNKVTGPGSATDNAIARFDATTGKLIQNSGVSISDANAVSGMLSGTFASEGNAGNSGASTFNVNFSTLGQKVRATLTGNCTFTFTFPGVGNYILKLTQDATGNRTPTLPATARAASGEVSLSGAANSVTVWAIYWDGTNSYISAMPAASTATVSIV